MQLARRSTSLVGVASLVAIAGTALWLGVGALAQDRAGSPDRRRLRPAETPAHARETASPDAGTDAGTDAGRRSRADDRLAVIMLEASEGGAGHGHSPAQRDTADPRHGTASTAASALPATLSREQIVAAFAAVRPRVSACLSSAPATVRVAYATVTISTTGQVTEARLEGELAATPVGSCVASSVRAAHFPRFAQPTMTVRYPFPR